MAVHRLEGQSWKEVLTGGLIDEFNAEFPNAGKGWTKYLVDPVEAGLRAQAAGGSFVKGFEGGLIGDVVNFATSEADAFAKAHFPELMDDIDGINLNVRWPLL
jgi:hypothetical protein